jgi:hypothetical protein
MRAPEVVAAAGDGPGGVQQELNRCQIETATPICRSAQELTGHMRALRQRLAVVAADEGLRLLPSGTPLLPEPDPPPISPTGRYRAMTEHFGALTHTVTTCSAHVHVSIPNRATGVQISNHLRGWLPLLLAMNANSPYNNGPGHRVLQLAAHAVLGVALSRLTPGAVLPRPLRIRDGGDAALRRGPRPGHGVLAHQTRPHPRGADRRRHTPRRASRPARRRRPRARRGGVDRDRRAPGTAGPPGRGVTHLPATAWTPSAPAR